MSIILYFSRKVNKNIFNVVSENKKVPTIFLHVEQVRKK